MNTIADIKEQQQLLLNALILYHQSTTFNNMLNIMNTLKKFASVAIILEPFPLCEKNYQMLSQIATGTFDCFSFDQILEISVEYADLVEFESCNNM